MNKIKDFEEFLNGVEKDLNNLSNDLDYVTRKLARQQLEEICHCRKYLKIYYNTIDNEMEE